jgi:hypothetical protein
MALEASLILVRVGAIVTEQRACTVASEKTFVDRGFDVIVVRPLFAIRRVTRIAVVSLGFADLIV